MSLSVGQNGNKATQAQSVKPQKSGGIQRSDSIDHLPKELVGTGKSCYSSSNWRFCIGT